MPGVQKTAGIFIPAVLRHFLTGADRGDVTANGRELTRMGSGGNGSTIDGHRCTLMGEKVRDVVVGCDVAKHTDFTVLIAMAAKSGRCLEMERFNH